MRKKGAKSAFHFSLTHGLFFSTLIHVAPVALWIIVASLDFSSPPKREALNLDLFGIISDRQLDERRAREIPQVEVAAPKPEVTPEIKSKPVKSDVKVKAPKATPRRLARPAPQATPTPPQTETEHEETRSQQMISREALEATLLRQYITELSRAVRARLIYPLKAKAKGWTGITAITFTVEEDGKLAANSERVLASSGYAELDEAACQAVRAVETFPKPPKRMENITISVVFSEERR